MEYYKRREPKNPINYEDYWDGKRDPDGNIRDRTTERSKFMANFNEEIDYVSNLKGSRICDIGCGLGFFLSALGKRWQKCGVEVSKIAQKHAKKYGDIQTTMLYPKDFFDVVTMFHVIEHLQSPEDAIKKVKHMLKPGGHFVIATPDFDSAMARRFGDNYRMLHDDTHISLFTNESMHRFLRDNGFEILKVDYPFFNTEYFTEENLLRQFDTSKISPPAYGSFMTFYTRRK